MKIKNLYTLTLCLTLFAISSNAQSSLAVTVFHDLDGNGIANVGDPIIPGVLTTELRLWRDNNNDGNIDGGDTEFMHDLGVGGVYTFGVGNVLPNDNYILEYVETGALGSYYVTKMVSVVGLSDLDNDLDPMTNIAGFALLNDTPETFIDLGLVIAGNIGSFVWEDLDGDGIQDGGEPAINGVTVTLLDAITMAAVVNDIDFAALTNPTVTAVGGLYTFDNLPPGQYIVEFSVPAPSPDPWYPTMSDVETDATDVTNDSDAENDPTSPNYLQSHTIILLSDDITEEDKIDAGFFQSADIGSFVWEDIDGNGLQDGGEPGINGVTVTLLDALTLIPIVNDADFIPLANPIVTAGGGIYTFANLVPGQYIVEFSVPAPSPDPWYPTQVTVNTDAADPMDDSDAENNSAAANYLQTHTIILLSDETDEEDKIDAGFFQASIIGDWVWEDLNGDGIQDAGEPGIDGVVVSLLDDLGAPAIGADGLVIPDETTMGGGFYDFMLVAPGDYQVQFNLPAPIGGVDWYPTEFDPAHTDANDPDIDSDANNDDTDVANYLKSHVITTLSAETDEELRIDAGFWLPIIVGDHVFCDENGNGIDDDGVGGVDGVDVRIIDSSTGLTAQDADGIDLTTTTAGGGDYMFDLVPPGFYIIEFAFTGATPDPPFVFTLQNDPDGLGDDFSDSDVDPDPFGGAFGQTEEIEIISQEVDEEMKWDAGVYQVINILGTIWIEDDGNSTFDAGESGPGGVFLEIFNAADGSKVDDTFTNSGDYEFIGLPPGEYFISFDVTGTALESATACPGSNNADDMVDNDDNGTDGIIVTTTNFTALSNCDPATPPEILYIDFCYFFDCDQPNPLASTVCDGVLDPDIICDINILGTFCNLMPDTDSGGNQPNPLCPSGGGPHNISWFAFVAYGGNYSITVTPTGCNGSTTGQEGVQIGLYTDCTFTETVYCDPACSTDPVTFDSSILEEGQTYYFFIDGCSSSQCSYEVDIMGSPIAPNLLPMDVCIVDATTGQNICADATYCPDAVIDFIATDFNLTVDFSWTVTALSGGPYDGNAIEMTEDELLSITFPNEGVYEVCLTQVDNGCAAQQWNGNICRQVTIEGIDDEMFDPITKCTVEAFDDVSELMPMDPNGDGTIGWQGGSPPFMEGANTFTVTTAEGCMYEQEFELMLFPESVPGVIDTTICPDELSFFIDVIELTPLSFAGTLIFDLPDHLLVNTMDLNSCDSIIDINVELLQVTGGVLDTVSCIPNEGVILQFDYFDGLSTDVQFLTFEWFDPIGNPLPDTWNPLDPLDNIAPLGISGTYMLTITIDKNGKTCVFDYTIDIDFDDFLPPNPDISGPGLEVCEADSIVTYTAINFGGANVFTWDFPSDVASSTTSGAFGEVLTINWSGSAGGTISLITDNGCGESGLIDIDITVIPQPTPSFNFITEACIDSCIIIEFVGDDSSVFEYDWNFDGGIEDNGTGSEGPGPHCVKWPDAGDKTITLSYIDNSGCVSTVTTEIVSVIAPIAPPIITCNPNTGEVSFSWDDVPGNLGYEVEVTSTSTVTSMLHVGVLTGTTFTVDNLADGETVTIILTILTDDACQMITATSPGCTSQNCIAPNIELTSDTISFCLDVNSGNATISYIVLSGENGTGIYTGPGIIDGVNGIFDPSVAGFGIHTISFLFMTDDLPTPCIGNQSIQIEVIETPVALFSSDVDTICITDVFNLTYEGTAGANSLIWVYGVDGSGTDGQTPIVTYTSEGEKTIRLFVIKDGCESESITRTVFVQPELEALTITCSIQEIDQVEFSWNSVPGATGYSVSINSGPPFTTTQTSHGEMGLSPNQNIAISVTVLSDSKCPGGTFLGDCDAVTCPDFEIMFAADPPIPSLCVDGNHPIITLEATPSGGAGGGMLSWSGPNVTGDQFDPNGLAEGDHQINVIYEEGSCEGDSFFIVNITTTPLAAFTVDNTTICVGDTVNITYEGSQLPGQVISWTPAGLVTEPNPGEYIAIFNTDGVFDIQLDVVNGICNTPFDMETITVEPELEFGLITCDPPPGMDNVTFKWDAVDCATEYEVFITIETGAEVSQGIQTTTEYIESGLPVDTEVFIRVTAFSECACGDIDGYGVCETIGCVDIDLILSTMDNNFVFCYADDLAPIELLFNPDGTQGTGSGIWSGSPNVTDEGIFDIAAAGVGTHTLVFDYLESEGCPHVDSLTFTVNDVPSVSLNPTEITCYNQTNTMLEVIPSGGSGNYTITINGDPADLINVVTPGSQVVEIMDDNGCTATESTVITVPIELMINISGSTELILGDSSTYAISSTVFDGVTIDSVVWLANDSIICNNTGCFSLDNQMPTVTTDYEVFVFYNNGCPATATLTVEVTEPPIPPMVSIFEIPNIMSPNGDGDNDTWQIVSNDEDISVSSINIFDRWGAKVWTNGPFMAMGNTVTWDGLYNGKVLQPGVYVYFVNFVQGGRVKVRSGDITIIN